jgi:SPP1 family predicted phage head-tail adaptor
VIIQERTGTEDDLGQPIDAWTTVAEPWADIQHLNGLSAIKAGADHSVVMASIRLRYRFGLNAGMRVLHGATVFEILAVLPDERGRVYLDLTCKVIQ